MLLLLHLQVPQLVARLERRLLRWGCLRRRRRRRRRLLDDRLVQVLGHVALGLVVYRVKVGVISAVVVMVVVQLRVDDLRRIFGGRRRRRGVSGLVHRLLLRLLKAARLTGVALALLRLALPLCSNEMSIDIATQPRRTLLDLELLALVLDLCFEVSDGCRRLLERLLAGSDVAALLLEALMLRSAARGAARGDHAPT